MRPATLMRFALALVFAWAFSGPTALAQNEKASHQPGPTLAPAPAGHSFARGGGLSEDFEAGIPVDWAIFDNGIGTEQSWEGLADADLGNIASSQYENVDSGLAEDWLVTPLVAVTDGAAVLSFDAAQFFTTDYGSVYSVRVSTTSQTDPAGFTEVASYTEADFPFASDGASTFDVDLSAYTGQSVYIAFVHVNDDGDYWYLDNVALGGGSPVSIAEARAQGAGATVIVEGTVSRAMGAFTYLQDGTAGLTIRQTSGAFFDAVADGTITEGTQLTVNGTLSEFAGLLQINEADLGSFTVDGQGDAPAPQAVTLQELIDNGEAYEAELVQATDLTTDATGTFAAATSYDVTDPSATLTDGLRIPNATDSDVDGTAVPEDLFTFTGVVGQFNFDDPAAGYQLLAIEATDITVQLADALAFAPPVLETTLESGATGVETVTITNTTGAVVAFDFAQYGAGGRLASLPPQAPHLWRGKGEPDPRSGSDAARDAGGPDAFGYQWIDSNEPGGPVFSFVDISATGTALVLGDDQGQVVPLPFTFAFYGVPQTSIQIASNGYLTFGDEGTAFVNQGIPDAVEPNDLIAPFWSDLDPGDGVGTVYYQDMGDGRFVVQWNDVPPFPGPGSGGDTYTFQAILHSNGAILFQYATMNGPLEFYTVGIEDAAGTDGLQIALNEPYIEDGLAVLIQARPLFVTAVSPATGTIPAGGSVDVDVTFDATGLNAGVYEGTLAVETDLASEPSVFELPVELTVTGMPVIAIDPASVAFGDVIVGASAADTVTVINNGTDDLVITTIASDNADVTVSSEGGLTVAPGDSVDVVVTFSPSAAGPLSATITLTTNKGAGTQTIAVSGNGLAAPMAAVDPASLTFTLGAGETQSQELTLSNTAAAGAASLDFEITVEQTSPLQPAQTAAPAPPAARTGSLHRVARADGSVDARDYTAPTHGPRTTFRGGEVFLTHSLSQEITELNSVSCNAGGLHTDNSYWRTFDLVEFGVNGDLDVTSVDIGVETALGATGSQPATLNFYTLEGPFVLANLTEIGSVDVEIADQSLTVLSIPVTGVTVPAGSELVVELFTPEGQTTGNSFFIGSNTAGETAPGYLSAAECGITEPTATGDIGFPDFHIVMNVHGEAGPAAITVTPESGTVAPGADATLTVTANAADLAPGPYEFQIHIATNEPANALVVVPVTLAVSVANEGAGELPTEFVLDQNYPNPFSGATTIKYALPEAEHVRIEVYDAVGRRVAVLLDAEQPAAFHEVRWDASALASGLYVYRIQAGDYSQTLKMVVAR